MPRSKLHFLSGHLVCWFVMVLALFVLGCGLDVPRPDALQAGQTPSRAAGGTPAPKALRAAYIEAAQRAASAAYAPNLAGDVVRFDNPSQRFAGVVNRSGLTVEPHVSSRPLALRTARIGCAEALVEVEQAVPELRAARIEVPHAAWLTEWYVPGPLGVEHGYDVATRPCVGRKRIELAVEGDFAVHLDDPDADARGDTVRFVDAHGRGNRGDVVYSDLFVTDARGAEVPAWFTVDVGDAAKVVLVVDDAAATYPLRIDPLIWLEQTKLVASDGAGSDFFGGSVALSGDTAIVGAWADDVGANQDQGSAYVFLRNGTTWTEQQKLTASDGAMGDYFGGSVALSGDTAIVGATYADVGANSNQGSAYVFVRNGTTWTKQQKLTASDGGAFDWFGSSVVLLGDTAIVGSMQDSVGANGAQGSAYVFVRTGATWTEQQKLTASDGAAGDRFGASVALSGNTAIVGANYGDGITSITGSAYVFVRTGSSWTEQQKLTANDGAAGDQFGCSVALSGDTAIVGAYQDDAGAGSYQGSAYVFVRSGTMWTQQQKLTASDSTANDYFGVSVALSGETAIVGATNQGSAYVFVRSGSVWTERQKLTNNLGNNFGNSVALSGDTAIVGANANQGSAYVFRFGEANSCNNPMQPAGTPCDDRSECTVNDVCDGNGVCKGTFAAACPAAETCQHPWCNPTNGVCRNVPMSDLTPCLDGGKCISGGCYFDNPSTSSASSSSTSGTSGMGGMAGSGGMGGMSAGGMGGTGMGASGQPDPAPISGPLQLRGSGLSCSTNTNEQRFPAMLGVAACILAMRRRRLA